MESMAVIHAHVHQPKFITITITTKHGNRNSSILPEALAFCFSLRSFLSSIPSSPMKGLWSISTKFASKKGYDFHFSCSPVLRISDKSHLLAPVSPRWLQTSLHVERRPARETRVYIGFAKSNWEILQLR